LKVNQSHRDEVHDAPEAVRVLAAGDRTALQAIAVGENARGVQFHPELDGRVVKKIIEHRRGILDDDIRARGRSGSVDELVAGTEDTPLAERVIVNFLRGFCR
jgi:GMP synthase-like glutamine amidotransferase